MFGPAIPAGELQITDATHKVAALRHMKKRLRESLEALLAANDFPIHTAELAPAGEQPPAAQRQPAPESGNTAQNEGA